MNFSISTLLKILKSKWDKVSCSSPSKRALQEENDKVCFLTQPISYEDFFYEFVFCNKPCVLGKWATEHWRSRHDWIMDDTHCKPDFDHLNAKFAGSKVPVADCSQRYFNSQCKSQLKLEDFLSYWMKYIAEGHPKEDPCLYLKDWHFVKEFEDYQAYTVPIFFQSDWLNEFSKATSKDDFRFVYMGPKGSWTPFHADVYRSFSWSANICGRKKWILFPPGEESILKNDRNELPYDITAHATDLEKINYQIIIQEPGEVIFVPSGWFHQVHNLEDTISINHNWLNGGNLGLVVNFLLTQLRLVENEISDCKSSMSKEEWIQQCQAILKADSGTDFNEFVTFLLKIADSRMKMINVQMSKWPSSSMLQEYFASSTLKDELCTVIQKRLCQIHLNANAPERMNVAECNITNILCFNHTIFDLCMILDALDHLLHKSNLCLEQSAYTEAELALSMVHKCLLRFVDTLTDPKSFDIG